MIGFSNYGGIEMYSDFDPEEIELTESYEEDYHVNDDEKGPFFE